MSVPTFHGSPSPAAVPGAGYGRPAPASLAGALAVKLPAGSLYGVTVYTRETVPARPVRPVSRAGSPGPYVPGPVAPSLAPAPVRDAARAVRAASLAAATADVRALVAATYPGPLPRDYAARTGAPVPAPVLARVLDRYAALGDWDMHAARAAYVARWRAARAAGHVAPAYAAPVARTRPGMSSADGRAVLAALAAPAPVRAPRPVTLPTDAAPARLAAARARASLAYVADVLAASPADDADPAQHVAHGRKLRAARVAASARVRAARAAGRAVLAPVPSGHAAGHAGPCTVCRPSLRPYVARPRRIGPAPVPMGRGARPVPGTPDTAPAVLALAPGQCRDTWDRYGWTLAGATYGPDPSPWQGSHGAVAPVWAVREAMSLVAPVYADAATDGAVMGAVMATLAARGMHAVPSDVRSWATGDTADDIRATARDRAAVRIALALADPATRPGVPTAAPAPVARPASVSSRVRESTAGDLASKGTDPARDMLARVLPRTEWEHGPEHGPDGAPVRVHPDVPGERPETDPDRPRPSRREPGPGRVRAADPAPAVPWAVHVPRLAACGECDPCTDVRAVTVCTCRNVAGPGSRALLPASSRACTCPAVTVPVREGAASPYFRARFCAAPVDTWDRLDARTVYARELRNAAGAALRALPRDRVNALAADDGVTDRAADDAARSASHDAHGDRLPLDRLAPADAARVRAVAMTADRTGVPMFGRNGRMTARFLDLLATAYGLKASPAGHRSVRARLAASSAGRTGAAPAPRRVKGTRPASLAAPAVPVAPVAPVTAPETAAPAAVAGPVSLDTWATV